MNRREVLKGAAATIGAAMLPAPSEAEVMAIAGSLPVSLEVKWVSDGWWRMAGVNAFGIPMVERAINGAIERRPLFDIAICDDKDGNHYPFITLAESVRRNALRHQANGDRYVRDGKPDYALGSYRKAQKNFELAERLQRWGAP
jgi:hypothetical protein